MGAVQPDAAAGAEALGPYEPPDPADAQTDSLIRDFVLSAGFETSPSGHGWSVVVPRAMDRNQVVYIGFAGIDPEGRAILSLVSICGPANSRDSSLLLKMNARMVEGHFAIRHLRGEEYFVVIHNVAVVSVPTLDPRGLIARIADTADTLEDRLLRGRDIY